METNGKLTQDGVTCLSYRNLNKMLRFCLLFAGVAFLEKLGTILRQKQPILRLKTSILSELHAPSYV